MTRVNIFYLVSIVIIIVIGYTIRNNKLCKPLYSKRQPVDSMKFFNKQIIKKKTIIDANLTFDQAVSGSNAPLSVLSNLRLLKVSYYSFDGNLHVGQLLVNYKCAGSLALVFREILRTKFPIESVIPIVLFRWSDSVSMFKNNSSGFNYRCVDGTQNLSMHSFGFAVDINPKLNPYIKGMRKFPSNSSYDTAIYGTFNSNSPIVKLFKKYNWKWGGDWIKIKDYQHFYFDPR
jgi:peptidoglycan L-alanyl-D-glutamate endopeptidase CwlK